MADEKDGKVRYGIVNFERRRYPRFSVDLPIEYSRMDSSIKQEGRVANASEGGMLLYLQEKVEVGEQLKVRLFFPAGPDLLAVETLVELAWVDIHLGKEWGDYRCGVRFVDVSPEDMDRLSEFLKGLSH